MKILVWGVVIAVVYMIYHFTIGTVLAKYDSCYVEATSKVSGATESVSNICACITTVKQENNFAGFIYEGSKTRKDVENTLEMHNTECTSNTIKPPQETFYMSAGTKR